MLPPSYARTTASSMLKSNPKTHKTADTNTRDKIRKKLKRPSLLTEQERQFTNYKRSLIYIKPHKPHAPCPMSNLPPELRAMIYTHVFSNTTHPMTIYNRSTDTFQFLWPALLQVCRALRIEASYTYFTTTPFTFSIRNLNFAHVRKWVNDLSAAHRKLLARNKQQLTIVMAPHMVEKYTWPPKDFLLDDMLKNHWKACERFGNLYAIESKENRKQLILFCRLAAWWSWCGEAGHRDLLWKHECFVDYRPSARLHLLVWRLLTNVCEAITARAVKKTWTRNQCGTEMKAVAMRFLDALEGQAAGLACPMLSEATKENQESMMKRARKVIKKW